MNSTPYYHVDVFSATPFAGNGLTIFTEAAGWTTDTMQILTREMRQFESIFLQERDGNKVRARIFTVSEELNFAGHPVLGAAATLHDLLKKQHDTADWLFELNKKNVDVRTRRTDSGYEAVMDQGKAVFGKVLDAAETVEILKYINASPADLLPGLSPTVVSTGLPYLIIPLADDKFRAAIGAPGLEELLHHHGAQFIGLLDIATRSIRTGDNDGSTEDIATGSLAGPAAAFLVASELEQRDTPFTIYQGANLHRDSRLHVEVRSCPDGSADIIVKGDVCKIGNGWINVIPAAS